MLNMKYKDVLDIEWTLRSAELRAKTEWDKMVIYKDDDEPILYELAYEKVKGLRDAQKAFRNMYQAIKKSDIEIEYNAES